MRPHLERAVSEPGLRVLVAHRTHRAAIYEMEQDLRELRATGQAFTPKMALSHVVLANSSVIQYAGGKAPNLDLRLRGFIFDLIVNDEALSPSARAYLTTLSDRKAES